MIKKEQSKFKDKYFVLKIIAVTIMIFSILTILSQTKKQMRPKAYADSAVLLNRAKSDYTRFQDLLLEDRSLVWTFNGSSTTANGGNYSGNTRNYIEILSSFMATEYGRLNDKMLNLAVGGYTVKNFTYSNAEPYKPDIAYIAIGKNDAAYFLSNDGSYHHNGTKPSANSQNPNLLYFIDKVKTFIDDAQEAGALVILGVPNGMEQTYGDQRVFYEEYYAPALREIAVEKGVLYIDYLARYLSDTQAADQYLFKADRMHVNGLGYLVLANTLIMDLDLDKNNSVFSTLGFRQQMDKKHAPYFVPLTPQEDTYALDADTQKLANAGYTSYKKTNLNNLMSSNPVVFMGGAATAGVMSDSVIERSFYQYFYRNNAPSNSEIVAGNSSQLLQMSQNVVQGSVIFYMPEIFDSKGNNLETTLNNFESNVRNIVTTLASSKGCRVVLMTPFPQGNLARNAVLSGFVQVVTALAQEKGLALIDFYGYGNKLVSKNSNLMRNWTQPNGLPNYVAHFEMAKYIAKFLNRDVNTIISAGGETLILTNPSATGGQERENITPICSNFNDSTDTKRFKVREIEDLYPNDSIAYYYIKGSKSTRVYSLNGYVTIEHTSIGNYIFRSYIVRGNKTIFFNDIFYEIMELDNVLQTPQYGVSTNFVYTDYSNIFYRNNTNGSAWLPLTNENVISITNSKRVVALTPAPGSNLVGIKSQFPIGALTQNFNTLTFTMSTRAEGLYKYRIWYYKADNSFVEITPEEGIVINIREIATTFYYDISKGRAEYNNIQGYSVQIMGSNDTVFLHSTGIIELPNIPI